jgi:hypothetical protein
MKAVRKAAQHYVPQFILRNFACNEKKTQIWVFSKKTSKIFQTNIRNVASEKDFYDIPIDGKEFSFDPTLTQLETYAAPIIKKIVKEENLEILALITRLFLVTSLLPSMLAQDNPGSYLKIIVKRWKMLQKS